MCGGIAAYKAVEVCRQLVDAGVHVAPVLTAGATRFVGAATFSALASEPAQRSLWDEASPIPHTALGQAADLVVVAPATAHLLARYAAGLADDLLTATLLATRAPVVVCPAMHTEMWEHPAVQDNLERAAPPRGDGRRARGRPPGRRRRRGRPAGRTVDHRGPGPLGARGGPGGRLTSRGVRVVVSAGGTREPIDPVRFITNRSSGKQGHALADAAARRGAAGHPGHHLADRSRRPRRSMWWLSRRRPTWRRPCSAPRRRPTSSSWPPPWPTSGPRRPAEHKLAKEDGVPELVLEPTPDILAGLAARRRPGQVLVGFAAETDDVIERGRRKLERKGVDLLVVNDVSAAGVGFDHDTNAVTILDAARRPDRRAAHGQRCGGRRRLG